MEWIGLQVRNNPVENIDKKEEGKHGNSTFVELKTVFHEVKFDMEKKWNCRCERNTTVIIVYGPKFVTILGVINNLPPLFLEEDF